MDKTNHPTVITSRDVEDKTLLVRALRDMSDRLAAVETGHSVLKSQVAAIPPPVPATQTQADLESLGNNPLNIQDLHGIAAEPQLSKLPQYPTTPTGLILQQLADGHLFRVPNGAGYHIYMVVGGNPNTLFTVV